MHVINLEFDDLDRIPVAALFGQTGVYVLWSRAAESRPTYLGEGKILSRLSDHVGWLTRGMRGVAGITSTDGSASQRAKRDAEIAEAVLLFVADDIGRTPTRNDAPAKRRRVEQVFRQHGVLRLNVRGYHPLKNPWLGNSKLTGRAELTVGADGHMSHPWRRSPR